MIDAHNHLGRWLSDDGDWLVRDVDQFIAMLDAAGVETIVNLDGRWGDELVANIARYDMQSSGPHSDVLPRRLVSPRRRRRPGSAVETLDRQLEASAAAGARGVKVWKDLGLQVRDFSGALVMPDDPRVVAVLQAAGDLGLPVLIHTADPVAFFEPLTPENERWDELQVHPEWWFGGSGVPTFVELMNSLDRLIAQCPGTTFIGAHVGCWAEDLEGVGQMLASHPQWNVDIAGRLGELGRRPQRLCPPRCRVPRPRPVRDRLLSADRRRLRTAPSLPGDRRSRLRLLRRRRLRRKATGPSTVQPSNPASFPASIGRTPAGFSG